MTIGDGFLIGNSVSPRTSLLSTPSAIKNSFTGLKFYGGYIIDSIFISKKVKSDIEIISETVCSLPEWTWDIVFLAAMNGTVDGSNITGIIEPPQKWLLYRKEEGVDCLYKVTELDLDTTSYIDYKVAGLKNVQYFLYAASTSMISAPIVFDKFNTTFCGYFLIDAEAVDNGNVYDVETYHLDLNLSTEKVTNNNDVTFLKNYTKYDSVIFGNRDFLSGSINSILGYYNPDNDELEYTWDSDYIDQFRKFINNQKQKYLKFKNGKVIKVVTTSTNGVSFEYKFDDSISQQIPTVTVYYQEVSDVEDLIS
ncbi:hypothetical protein BJV85_002882 [Clostridium acetobutylicum]|uniref:Uncharacterized protein n=1 Tax=Clostridium acetobutylicum (strain ATCC 824 / DSM 792 / JCM 1419 / IAM 19013 / LMG 5710 / NBRC 13948 / NRRL B-527 / VKM B-1787 / 2291 / W) TaxID=272562 RepID=Q97K06_CLOAB|nr:MULTISPECIES: hypothetical protein [Clostridium]AAK79089.1 Hypothetical protein CA_C1115 [Clostridium acetobutylicum ATCC 824]ADZ20165.1 Conserved hypothetical protein [Clostridium acetobutylicum EA 2018]AEI31627.1 hypothetical protein SMB_G1134 [Clostridium acetobutylicum DSM 1731]AWV81657.1 hypothetical protein DK921_16475 [Clostridium acetobutylicum]MBC2393303.1 hypothetical protein [Clostridium acetobutylicum]